MDIGILNDIERWISVFLIPIGIILLLYGYRLYKLFLALIGFIIGLVIGIAVGGFTGEPILTGLLCGVLGALIFYLLYKLGIFMLGFLTGFLISVLFTIAASADVVPVLFLIAGVLCGILSLYIEKAIIVTLSAYNGAAITVSGFSWLLYPEYMAQLYSLIFTNPQLALSNFLTLILVNLIVMAAGILFQYNIIPNRPGSSLPRSDEKEKRESFQTTQPAKGSVEPQLISLKNEEDEVEKNGMKHGEIGHRGLTKNKNRPKLTFYPFNTNYSRSNESDSFDIKNHQSFPATSSKDFYSNTVAAIRDASIATLTKIKTDLNSLTTAIFNRFPDRDSSVAKELVQLPLQIQVLNGPQQGVTTEVYGAYNGSYYSSTIGREKSTEHHHIYLADPNNHVSRYHAELAMSDRQLFVRSLSNTNLLLLNGNEISADQFTPVRSGDQLELAHLKVKLL